CGFHLLLNMHGSVVALNIGSGGWLVRQRLRVALGLLGKTAWCKAKQGQSRDGNQVFHGSASALWT
ncbi:MAG: hypothetical protein ACRD3Y_10485, partial [Bryobacteraceae bacterium]